MFLLGVGLPHLRIRTVSIKFSMWRFLQGKNRFTKNIEFGVYSAQEISKQQQDYFSQLSIFGHGLNIKLCFSLREKHCFVLIVNINQIKGTIMGEHIHMQTYFENKTAKLHFIALPNYIRCSFYNNDILN